MLGTPANTWRELCFQEDVKRRFLELPILERLAVGIRHGVSGLKMPLDDEPIPPEDWVMPLLLNLRDTDKLKAFEQQLYEIEERLGLR
jgi:hypothetical protein